MQTNRGNTYSPRAETEIQDWFHTAWNSYNKGKIAFITMCEECLGKCGTVYEWKSKLWKCKKTAINVKLKKLRLISHLKQREDVSRIPWVPSLHFSSALLNCLNEARVLVWNRTTQIPQQSLANVTLITCRKSIWRNTLGTCLRSFVRRRQRRRRQRDWNERDGNTEYW